MLYDYMPRLGKGRVKVVMGIKYKYECIEVNIVFL